MDHIRQFDWSDRRDYSEQFVDESDLDGSCTSRIIKGTFRHPYQHEDEDLPPPKVSFKELLLAAKNKNNDNKKNKNFIFVPGRKPIPPYPKLSALNMDQHYAAVKVLGANQSYMDLVCLKPPSRRDTLLFSSIQQKYMEEQKEFLEWAKTLWLTNHCARALRPKAIIEHLYEAYFKMETDASSSLPMLYEMASQIPIESKQGQFEFLFVEDLVEVNLETLPTIKLPVLDKQFSVITNKCPLPESCAKHPCRILLPNLNTVSDLPMADVQEELSVFGNLHQADIVANENALKSLVEMDRPWTLSVRVDQRIDAGGVNRTVVVLGPELTTHRLPSRFRIDKAIQHLLFYALTRDSKHRLLSKGVQNEVDSSSEMDITTEQPSITNDDPTSEAESDSDNDDDNLVMDDLEGSETSNKKRQVNRENKDVAMETDMKVTGKELDPNVFAKIFNTKSCTCKGSPFETPPARSYQKWLLNKKGTRDKLTLLLHSTHKAVKDKDTEVIIQSIPEYQLELGASQLSESAIKSTALSLYLRRKAALLTARVDGQSGDLVTFEWSDLGSLEKQYGGKLVSDSLDNIHTVLTSLKMLRPGQYVLRHEVDHKANALLFVSRPASAMQPGSTRLTLEVVDKVDTDVEAKVAKEPPTLGQGLLPVHRFKKCLPLAFTPFKHEVVIEKTPKNKKPTRMQPAEWKKHVEKMRKEKKKNKKKKKTKV